MFLAINHHIAKGQLLTSETSSFEHNNVKKLKRNYEETFQVSHGLANPTRQHTSNQAVFNANMQNMVCDHFCVSLQSFTTKITSDYSACM